MRIPTHLAELVARLGLRSFVKSSTFPIDTHCESIDLFKRRLRRHPRREDEDVEAVTERAPRDEALASMIAVTLDEEGLLETHVLDVGTVTVDGEGTWHRICLAAGWVVLQAYELKVKNGDWEPDE